MLTSIAEKEDIWNTIRHNKVYNAQPLSQSDYYFKILIQHYYNYSPKKMGQGHCHWTRAWASVQHHRSFALTPCPRPLR